MPRYSITRTCPNCGKTNTMLEDEYNDHDCPYCGHDPNAEEPQEEEEDDTMNPVGRLYSLLIRVNAAPYAVEKSFILGEFYKSGDLERTVRELNAAYTQIKQTTDKIEEALMQKPDPRFLPFYSEECGCGEKAEYLVYAHAEPHCKACVLEAIDSEKPVIIRRIAE